MVCLFCKLNIIHYSLTLGYQVKGVRKSYTGISVVYYVEKNESRGVRNNENIYYEILKKKKNDISVYGGRSCVCGSLKHLRTTHVDCVLNKQYDDV